MQKFLLLTMVLLFVCSSSYTNMQQEKNTLFSSDRCYIREGSFSGNKILYNIDCL